MICWSRAEISQRLGGELGAVASAGLRFTVCDEAEQARLEGLRGRTRRGALN